MPREGSWWLCVFLLPWALAQMEEEAAASGGGRQLYPVTRGFSRLSLAGIRSDETVECGRPLAGGRRLGGSVGSSGYGEGRCRERTEGKARSLIKGLALLMSSESGLRGPVRCGVRCGVLCKLIHIVTVSCSRGQSSGDCGLSGYRILCEMSKLRL